MKWKEAVRMAAEHRAAFQDLNESVDPRLVREWEAMDTVPLFQDGRRISVFSMTESPGKQRSEVSSLYY